MFLDYQLSFGVDVTISNAEVRQYVKFIGIEMVKGNSAEMAALFLGPPASKIRRIAIADTHCDPGL